MRVAGLQQLLLAATGWRTDPAAGSDCGSGAAAVAQQQVVAQQYTLIAGLQQQLEVVTQRQLSAYMHHRLQGAVIWGGFQVCFHNDV